MPDGAPKSGRSPVCVRCLFKGVFPILRKLCRCFFFLWNRLGTHGGVVTFVTYPQRTIALLYTRVFHISSTNTRKRGHIIAVSWKLLPFVGKAFASCGESAEKSRKIKACSPLIRPARRQNPPPPCGAGGRSILVRVCHLVLAGRGAGGSVTPVWPYISAMFGALVYLPADFAGPPGNNRRPHRANSTKRPVPGVRELPAALWVLCRCGQSTSPAGETSPR